MTAVTTACRPSCVHSKVEECNVVATLNARLSYRSMWSPLRYRAVVQRAAVRWMLAREEACGPISDPCWRALQTGNGLPFWVCSATGDFRSEEPRQIFDRKGGLFCDEPVSHASAPYFSACVTCIPCGKCASVCHHWKSLRGA